MDGKWEDVFPDWNDTNTISNPVKEEKGEEATGETDSSPLPTVEIEKISFSTDSVYDDVNIWNADSKSQPSIYKQEEVSVKSTLVTEDSFYDSYEERKKQEIMESIPDLSFISANKQ